MLKTFLNIFRVPELRNKVLFTLFMLMIYRIGFHVPIPGVDQTAFEEMAKKQSEGGDAFGRITAYLSIFSGGSLSQSTIFGLGVMPYISASIIFQLLATVVPSLEKLRKEGETGRRKIQEWTRYATVPLCIIQGHSGSSTCRARVGRELPRPVAVCTHFRVLVHGADLPDGRLPVPDVAR